ncbi:MAG TPA: pyruvate kinase [Actinomycetota bacterium]|nr:pyruvate kinase [Actinomycetota bacterium]
MRLHDELLLYRRTKIVATLGPSSLERTTVERLIDAGVNVFRLNMSHGDQESHRSAYELVRAAAGDAPIGILVDLCGAKIRVGRFAGGEIQLTDEEQVVVTTREILGGPGLIPSQYAELATDVHPGARIFLSDGFIELVVEEVRERDVHCRVIHGGVLKDRKGMNLPDVDVTAPSLTDKDRDDAAFALGLGVDYVALSFVRSPDDVRELKALFPEDHPVKVIAKIERPEALDCIDEILDESDGIMIARGDLGVELPPEMVPVVQRQLIARARARSKPCIVATQMLESMTEYAQPTRAEVSDVSTAVFSGADAVMLSGETAAGSFPVEAVQMMDRIARHVEAHLWNASGFRIDEDTSQAMLLNEALARSTAQLSRDVRARAIVVFSRTGVTARVVACARPAAPIIAVTSSEWTAPQLTLLWGVFPQQVKENDLATPNDLARAITRERGLAIEGQSILTVAGFAPELGESSPAITVLTL